MRKPINVLTGMDYWLDNLMCNVPEMAMCFHLNGIVQVHTHFQHGSQVVFNHYTIPRHNISTVHYGKIIHDIVCYNHQHIALSVQYTLSAT